MCRNWAWPSNLPITEEEALATEPQAAPMSEQWLMCTVTLMSPSKILCLKKDKPPKNSYHVGKFWGWTLWNRICSLSTVHMNTQRLKSHINTPATGPRWPPTLYLSTMGNRTGPSLDLLKFGKLSRCGMKGKPLQKGRTCSRHLTCPYRADGFDP